MRIERFAGVVVSAVLAAAEARASQSVAVGVDGAERMPFFTLMEARWTASRIYAALGVKLIWCSRAKAEITVQLDSGGPEADLGVMGFAFPYGRTSDGIHVFPARVLGSGPPQLGGILLGHVIAHEIGHVLQRVSRHSSSGVMKAHWNAEDLARMQFHPLAFNADDAELIWAGLERLAQSAK